MSTIVACFKWLDLLETQFDKSWAELEQLFHDQLLEDEDFYDIHSCARKHSNSLASCFSQLAHKSTTIFQNNAKLEAELIHLREELCTSRSTLTRLVQDKEYLTKQLQCCFEENQKLKAINTQEANTDEKTSATPNEKESILHLNEDTSTSEEISCCDKPDNSDISLYIERSQYFTTENGELREKLLEMESELVGARLDNVYLDKELAGRIQQLQLLLAAGTSPEMKERMWGQIEVEICLQRAKTIGQMCHTKQELRDRLRQEKNANFSPVSVQMNGEKYWRGDHFDGKEEESKCKQVYILKNPADDLGIAIVGGKDHNLPIIISEIFPNSAVARTNKINAGDIIVSVNGESMVEMEHKKAVGLLSSLRGRITMDLRGVEVCGEDDPGNVNHRFYQMFHPLERRDSEGSRRSSHPGRAVSSVDLDKLENGRAVSSVDLDKLENVAKESEELDLGSVKELSKEQAAVDLTRTTLGAQAKDLGEADVARTSISEQVKNDIEVAIAVNGALTQEFPEIHISPRRKAVS